MYSDRLGRQALVEKIESLAGGSNGHCRVDFSYDGRIYSASVVHDGSPNPIIHVREVYPLLGLATEITDLGLSDTPQFSRQNFRCRSAPYGSAGLPINQDAFGEAMSESGGEIFNVTGEMIFMSAARGIMSL